MSSPTSPLHDEHVKLGAKMTEFGGWLMPVSYPSGTIAEHLACRDSAAAFDVSHLGTVRLKGPESHDLIQRSFTNDLEKIAPGHAQYTHLLAEDGHVVDDIIIWWRSEEVFDVMPNASNTSSVRDTIGGDDITQSRALIAVQGPRARSVVEKVIPAAASLVRFAVGEFEWAGTPVVVAGTGYTGEDGMEFAVPAEQAAWFWREVLVAGAVPAGLGARDTLRLEAGLPLHGHELGEGITPLHAGLGWVVGWSKEVFIGRSVLLDLRDRDDLPTLRGILSPERRPLRRGALVLRDGLELGSLSSGNFSPVLQRGIGMGLLSDVEVGETVRVRVRDREVEAQVVALPFIERGPAMKEPM